MIHKGYTMRSEYDIRRRIDFLINEMYKIKESQATDLFTHIHEIRKSANYYKELNHIYWMLDEPFPEIVESLRTH